MTKYAILTDTFVTGWVNCSTDDDGYPLTFDTLQDAEIELAEHLSDSEHLDLNPEDYKIVEITDYDQGYNDAMQGLECSPPFGDTARTQYKDGYLTATFDQLQEATE